MRSRAILAYFSVSASTLIGLTTVPADEVLEGPDEVREVDAVHRGAVADRLVEEDDVLVGVLLGQALDQVQLGADGPRRAGFGLRDGVDDVLRRADQVRLEDDLVLALGVHDHVDAGYAGADVVHGRRGEPAVHRAVPAPQDHLRLGELVLGETAARLVRVVHDALVEADAHLQYGSVPAEVLVG